jgi:hypothetical protein
MSTSHTNPPASIQVRHVCWSSYTDEHGVSVEVKMTLTLTAQEYGPRDGSRGAWRLSGMGVNEYIVYSFDGLRRLLRFDLRLDHKMHERLLLALEGGLR